MRFLERRPPVEPDQLTLLTTDQIKSRTLKLVMDAMRMHLRYCSQLIQRVGAEFGESNTEYEDSRGPLTPQEELSRQRLSGVARELAGEIARLFADSERGHLRWKLQYLTRIVRHDDPITENTDLIELIDYIRRTGRTNNILKLSRGDLRNLAVIAHTLERDDNLTEKRQTFTVADLKAAFDEQSESLPRGVRGLEVFAEKMVHGEPLERHLDPRRTSEALMDLLQALGIFSQRGEWIFDSTASTQ